MRQSSNFSNSRCQASQNAISYQNPTPPVIYSFLSLMMKGKHLLSDSNSSSRLRDYSLLLCEEHLLVSVRVPCVQESNIGPKIQHIDLRSWTLPYSSSVYDLYFLVSLSDDTVQGWGRSVFCQSNQL